VLKYEGWPVVSTFYVMQAMIIFIHRNDKTGSSKKRKENFDYNLTKEIHISIIVVTIIKTTSEFRNVSVT